MYFGSVRFFKNMILLAVIVMICIPTVTSIRYKSMYEETLQEKENILALDKMSFDDIYHPDERMLFDKPGYQNLYPDFYAPQALQATEAPEKTVYLTFDDGPSARTYEVLDFLDEYEVKATFFVVGKTDTFSRQAMRDIVANGHTLAMHTFTHEYKKIYSSVESYLEDMYKIFNLIKETTGVTPTYFRFPGGSINSHNYNIYQELISEMMRRGFVPCDWNVSSGDASTVLLSADTISNNVLTGSRNKKRAVVLMHDSYPHTTTVQALPEIIETLKENGYSFDKLTPQTKPVMFTYTY
ncbi:MAG: polysaccharide deacetylase [Oscillospiraceae bacterium]|nr:polysaccharide deacetylase [Oscillospiraceae bacterium]